MKTNTKNANKEHTWFNHGFRPILPTSPTT